MKKGKAGRHNNGFLPSSLSIISSCLKTVSTNATTVASTVKSAGVSVAASISAASDDHKEQVTWAGFDKLELSASVWRHVLLLGYQNGFQVLDVDNASNFSELVSRRDDGPVTFLQIQPIPFRTNDQEGLRKSHPLLLVVGGDEINCSSKAQNRSHVCGSENDKYMDSHAGNCVSFPRAVRFYSLRSLCYVHVLRFRSAVCMVRCSARIVAVSLATQICCYDALTLENKFSVLTYPVPQVGGQGKVGVNVGYGPMALGPRWLAYASNDPLLVNNGRLSPQTLSPAPGVSPSTSPVNGTLVAHYAMESGKQLAAGIVNLGDRGYKNLSKYCRELLPDVSNSPLSLNSGSRAGRSSITATDNAGVVVVKDFISRVVICQFRAHSTPISALCFDPSGTLLVTASVHGNSVNIFRIMPSCNNCGSGSKSYDSSTSYVHLYKFHRGIRAAIIQDICFSRFSQWIAVISSKGTCHVFVLSPFGGDVGFQTPNSNSEDASIAPVITLPWWSTSSCTISQQSVLPPTPVTLSVVSRIKDNNSGLLNTVSNAASSMSGNISVPSGALAAIFHNSIPCSSRQVSSTVKSLEHLLVYTPSGHVVQHEIQPSLGVESGGNSRPLSGSLMPSENAELSINIHPVQWWDVCRRSNWPEREDFISDFVVHKQDLSQKNTSTGRCESFKMDLSKSWERSHWYLSNAEVQHNTMRLPAWQKSKISFCMTSPPRIDVHANGEHEIEKFPVCEVEIRRKDLLPVFDHFHSMKSALNDRGLSSGRYSNAFTLEPLHPKEKANEETIICHSKPASFSSTESSDGGLSRRIEHLLDLDHLNPDQYMPFYQNSDKYNCEKRPSVSDELSQLDNNLGTMITSPSEILSNDRLIGANSTIANKPPSESKLQSIGVAKSEGALPSDIGCSNEVLRLCAPFSDAKVHGVISERMDSRKDSLIEEEHFLWPMDAFIEGDSKKVEPTESTSNQEEDMVRPSCDFVARGSQTLDPSGAQKPIDANTVRQEEDTRGVLFSLSEEGCETLNASIGEVKCTAMSRKNDLNQEEEDMFGGMFALLGEDRETLESDRSQNESEAATYSAVNSTINPRKDNLDDEQDMLGTMFASDDEG